VLTILRRAANPAGSLSVVVYTMEPPPKRDKACPDHSPRGFECARTLVSSATLPVRCDRINPANKYSVYRLGNRQSTPPEPLDIPWTCKSVETARSGLDVLEDGRIHC
jgi:hypothetical protein